MENINEKVDYCLSCISKPCKQGCPLENDITDFIKASKEHDYKKAYEIATATSVFQSVCGRICPHMSQCEGKCVRGIKGEPVGIGRLERFVADYHMEHAEPVDAKIEKNGHKVAVVGSGPSGITCAGELIKKS